MQYSSKHAICGSACGSVKTVDVALKTPPPNNSNSKINTISKNFPFAKGYVLFRGRREAMFVVPWPAENVHIWLSPPETKTPNNLDTISGRLIGLKAKEIDLDRSISVILKIKRTTFLRGVLSSRLVLFFSWRLKSKPAWLNYNRFSGPGCSKAG